MFKLKLIPQDKKFFRLFNELTAVLVEITDEFNGFLNEYSKKEEYTERITKLKEKGNKISENLLNEIISSFITPIDREDIHSLTKILNSIVEHVHAATIYFELYRIDSINKNVFALAVTLKEAVYELKQLMDRLEDKSQVERVYTHLQKLQAIEENGDKVYRDSVRALFRETEDPLSIIKWKDVYHRLENAVDKCSDAGNTILGMVLKYA